MNKKELVKLDLAVAKSEGMDAIINSDWPSCFVKTTESNNWWVYDPTESWELAGALLEKYKFNLRNDRKGEWVCWWEDEDLRNRGSVDAETPCIAICLAAIQIKE